MGASLPSVRACNARAHRGLRTFQPVISAGHFFREFDGMIADGIFVGPVVWPPSPLRCWKTDVVVSGT
jgi:hypothetical protein